MSALSLWLLPLLPLAGAAVLLLGGRRTDRVGPALGTGVAAASFGVAVWALTAMLTTPGPERDLTSVGYRWFAAGDFRVEMALHLDALSMCFALLITGVGTLIHIYSLGYLADDPGRRRFFGMLNLFLGAMLVLVLADNLVVLYLGWEGVGLASYLLIGFWQHKPVAASAAKKAFVMNRVGDMGLALAIAIAVAGFGTVDFARLLPAMSGADGATATALGLLLLLAACAKSAQLPLQAWLGDAMEGPTPVSALIHAATMVTAGVYLLVRCGPVIEAAPIAQTAVLVVGAATLLFGAIIGCAKDDIKKALAASTMSQIGYMILAAGLGPIGYVAAIGHLLTHGCFKAGLFLGAGSVMHGLDDETDMRRMGGLRAVMPITAVTFGLGYLAIIGVPPLSGFYTKDSIIEAALALGGIRGPVLAAVAIAGAAITAFYMTRVMVMTFFGAPRWAPGAHPHESPRSMTVPMIILAIGSVGAGGVLMIGGRLADFLSPAVGAREAHGAVPAPVVTVIVLIAVAIGLAIGVRATARVPDTAPRDVGPLTVAARQDLYQDVFNETVFAVPGRAAMDGLAAIEDSVVDGAVRAVPVGVVAGAQALRRTQTGYARSYALGMTAGALALTVAVAVWLI